jgi:hypothetical protein
MLNYIFVSIATTSALFALGAIAFETITQTRIHMFEYFAAGLAGE